MAVTQYLCARNATGYARDADTVGCLLDNVGVGFGDFLSAIQNPLVSIVIALGIAFAIVKLIANIGGSLRISG